MFPNFALFIKYVVQYRSTQSALFIENNFWLQLRLCSRVEANKVLTTLSNLLHWIKQIYNTKRIIAFSLVDYLKKILISTALGFFNTLYLSNRMFSNLDSLFQNVFVLVSRIITHEINSITKALCI